MAKIFSWRVLDGLLRGDLEQEKNPAKALIFWQIVLAAFYGACLGLFGLTGREGGADFRYMGAAAAKLPVLILGTTAVTFPSLYVFLALFGIRMRFRQMVGIVLAANTILATVIASLGPILAFFSFTSSSYAFILLLNVAICGLGGVLGIRLMLLAISKALPGGSIGGAQMAGITSAEEGATESEDGEAEDSDARSGPAPSAASTVTAPGAKAPFDGIGPPPPPPPPPASFGVAAGARGIMLVWLFLYAFVGTQMAWILRPFIGHPDGSFVLFRGKEGSFIDTVMSALSQYLSGGGM